MSDAAPRARRNPPRVKPRGPWARLKSTVREVGGLRSAVAGLIVLASAGALVWMGERGRPGPDPIPDGQNRAVCSLFINGRAVSTEIAVARPYDTLRLRLTAPARIPYAVLYRDDEGPVSVHLAPDVGRVAGSMRGESLPGNPILGAGWKTSTWYCLTSDHPFTLEEAKALADRGDEKNGAAENGLRARIFRLKNISP